MRSYKDLLELAGELERIGLSETAAEVEHTTGLCNALEVAALVKLYAKSWEFFSGCLVYPVPPPAYSLKGKHAAMWAYDSDLPKYTGVYGESRKDLALHIANCIREDYDLDVPFASPLLKAAAELDRLARGDTPKDVNHGLCELYLKTSISREDKYSMFNSWPERSGSQSFPVPHPTSSAVSAYYDYPLYKGAYGESRRRLAGHLSNCLRELYYAERLAKACGEHTAGS